MILFKETRPATVEDIRWIRKNLERTLEESRLRTIDPKLYDRNVRFSLIESVVLAVSELANNAIFHANPKPTFLSLTVRLVGAALRIELEDDGGSFENFEAALEKARDWVPTPEVLLGRGLWLVASTLQEIEYKPGTPNRLVGWRKLRRAVPYVLLISDDEDLQTDLKSMLHENYRVYSANSLSTAANVLRSLKIDAIVTDYRFACKGRRIFNAAFCENPMPIIMTASARDLSHLEHQPVLNIDHCLQTPFSKTLLISAIEISIANYTRRLIHLANYFGRSGGLLLTGQLPKELPGFRLEVLSGTASYGGGDVALVLQGKGFTRLVLADIMGHGLQAKAAAIALSAIVRTVHRQRPSTPDFFLRDISDIVREEPAFSDVITTLAVVDASEDGWIDTVCAGHPPVAIIHADRNFVIPVTGPLPGLLDKPVYRVERHRLRPGDKFVVISDGIDKDSSATAEFPSRLLRQLSKNPALPVETLCQDVKHWLTRKLGPAPKDDWTLMIGEYRGMQAPDCHTHQEYV